MGSHAKVAAGIIFGKSKNVDIEEKTNFFFFDVHDFFFINHAIRLTTMMVIKQGATTIKKNINLASGLYFQFLL